MGFFNKLFGQKIDETSAALPKSNTPKSACAKTINVTKNGVFIDGVCASPLTVTSLTAALGEPRIVPPRETSETKNYLLLWDNAGMRGYTKDLSAGIISELDVIFHNDEDCYTKSGEMDFLPRFSFSGMFLMDNKDPRNAISQTLLEKAYIFIETKRGNWKLNFYLTQATQKQIEADRDHRSEIIHNAAMPFAWMYVCYKEPRVSTGKYLHKKPESEVLVFENFNFKLAIVQELMYNQNLITPKFDVYDFAEDYAKREIDVQSEGEELIPEVKKWFKDLPINAALAKKVESLYLDGGNEVYGQIIPFWDGEDEMYDIKGVTPEELAQFPNLKRIEVAGISLSAKVRKLLTANGIEVLE
jgi:hypothetical protein